MWSKSFDAQPLLKNLLIRQLHDPFLSSSHHLFYYYCAREIRVRYNGFPTVLVGADGQLGGGCALAPPRLGGDPHVVQRVRVQVVQAVLTYVRLAQRFVLREFLRR